MQQRIFAREPSGIIAPQYEQPHLAPCRDGGFKNRPDFQGLLSKHVAGFKVIGFGFPFERRTARGDKIDRIGALTHCSDLRMFTDELGTQRSQNLRNAMHIHVKEKRLALHHAPGDGELPAIEIAYKTIRENADWQSKQKKSGHLGHAGDEFSDWRDGNLVAIADGREVVIAQYMASGMVPKTFG